MKRRLVLNFENDQDYNAFISALSVAGVCPYSIGIDFERCADYVRCDHDCIKESLDAAVEVVE